MDGNLQERIELLNIAISLLDSERMRDQARTALEEMVEQQIALRNAIRAMRLEAHDGFGHGGRPERCRGAPCRAGTVALGEHVYRTA